jgi:protease PrsW
MEWLSILTLAISPAIALLAYFYLKDRYHAEPIHWIVRLFISGSLLVFPTMVVQRSLVLGLGEFGESPFAFSFLLSGGLEEFLKWFIVYYLLYKHTLFDEPYDGIVYCVAVSLGFASLENILFAVYNDLSLTGFWFRALIPVSGHALFGVVMGYYMGKAKFHPEKERLLLGYSLIFPILWHGLLDWILLVFTQSWVWIVVPFMAILWLKGLSKVDSANRASPYRVVRPDEEINL